MTLRGTSILGFRRGEDRGRSFFALNPETGEALEPLFLSASAEEVDRAVALGAEAAPIYGKLSSRHRAMFLRAIADGLDAAAERLVERAHLETALPRPRLANETSRTSDQLRLFAALLEEGSWVDARIDPGDPSRAPTRKPDLRSMLRPIGIVAVFGASNFPLAFSVGGGDTASALAAGNPVIVKAHPAHPGAGEIAGEIIQESALRCGLPEGVFSLLFDSGFEVGRRLVEHPSVDAVAFTGSLAAGRALMDLAAARPRPIPCFMEMSSANPLFILPEAARRRGEEIARALHGSFTLGAGQFCTKPGLVFLERGPDGDALLERLRELVVLSGPQTALTPGIAASYSRGLRGRGLLEVDVTKSAHPESSCDMPVALLEADIRLLRRHPALAEELFGPTTSVLRYGDEGELLAAAEGLAGQLTATVIGTEADLARHAALLAILERKAGRIVFNGYPTGVEVCSAMVHGGPYPATSDGRSTSVGTRAILRFARPVCYQDCPPSLLPEELRDGNPLGIWRTVNGVFSRDAALKKPS